MSGLGYVFIGAGLLFALRPSAAARYPDGPASGERFVRFVAAPALIVLGVVIALGITIR
jgi:fumarate reductase subunit C